MKSLSFNAVALLTVLILSLIYFFIKTRKGTRKELPSPNKKYDKEPLESK
jgi:hypothetical protein